MEQEKPYRLGVHALIINKNNKFLVIQKNNYSEKDWTVIGGGREEGETAEENLFREIQEETNLDKSNYEIVGESMHKQEYDYPADVAAQIHGGKYRGQSYAQFLVRFTGNKEELKFDTNEIRTHKWVDFSELPIHLNFSGQYDIVRNVVEDLAPELVS
jgi:putative (di)nucleoside polyphosphate hydrolase